MTSRTTISRNLRIRRIELKIARNHLERVTSWKSSPEVIAAAEDRVARAELALEVTRGQLKRCNGNGCY